MSTGAKIAIGCGVALVLAVVAVAAGVFGLAWWGKGKVEKLAAEQQKIEELKKKANANPFSRPADGAFREDRLVAFLEVRKRVYAVYERHKDDLERRGQKKDADLGDVTKIFSVINELQAVQAQALADVGMSEDEYRFMVEAVYKTLWASEMAKSTGGKTASEVTEDAARKAEEEMAKAEEDPNLPEETRRAMREAREQMRQQAGEAVEAAREWDVPPGNVELFRKHEAEIKKYAMTGLEWLGM